MELKTLVGRRVRDLRTQKGLRIPGLAELVGLSEEAVGDIERGASWPRPDTVDKLAKALETSAGELFAYIPKAGNDSGPRAAALAILNDVAGELESDDIEILIAAARVMAEKRPRAATPAS